MTSMLSMFFFFRVGYELMTVNVMIEMIKRSIDHVKNYSLGITKHPVPIYLRVSQQI